MRTRRPAPVFLGGWMMVDLVTTTEVAAELRWKAQQLTDYGTVLASYISAATPVIESIAGPVVAATVTELHDGGPSVALNHTPNTVMSVTVDGAAVDYTVDLGAGIVYGPFPWGRQNVSVTYTVGMSPVPENVKRATIALIVYNWRRLNPQQQISEEVFAVPDEYAIPAATYQWLRPQQNTRQAGFA